MVLSMGVSLQILIVVGAHNGNVNLRLPRIILYKDNVMPSVIPHSNPYIFRNSMQV